MVLLDVMGGLVENVLFPGLDLEEDLLSKKKGKGRGGKANRKTKRANLRQQPSEPHVVRDVAMEMFGSCYWSANEDETK